jgi:hypothetical protein
MGYTSIETPAGELAIGPENSGWPAIIKRRSDFAMQYRGCEIEKI